jgi:hypothetical protein
MNVPTLGSTSSSTLIPALLSLGTYSELPYGPELVCPGTSYDEPTRIKIGAADSFKIATAVLTPLATGLISVLVGVQVSRRSPDKDFRPRYDVRPRCMSSPAATRPMWVASRARSRRSLHGNDPRLFVPHPVFHSDR